MNATRVATADVELSLQVSGPDDGPLALLVHGFPDNRRVWDRVVDDLERDHRVASYDVRGAGESSAPASRAGYKVSRLIDDLIAVLEQVAPDGRPVHLVGHDWGSIQLWGAVMRESTDARLRGRLASFTSISGPGVDLYAHFFRQGIRRRRFGTVGRQLLHSWYVGAFQLPVVPEVVIKRLGGRIRAGLEKQQQLPDSHWDDDTFRSDARHGLNLYRVNRPTFRRSTTAVPVQLIVPTKDAFLIPAVYDDIETFAPDLRRLDVVANHWIVQTQPHVVSDAVRAFVEDIERR
ncbi:alpha/beta fold hydrolase [Aeromicrobium sp.]|uniref:alpha/beta fold hydrolase n=1 Tax=Aeromicrobium sp. TaxID=1871063 RepID=UPI003D6A68AB